jgi:signal transduction histidine kinase
MERELIHSLPFEIEARVPIQLGRESISSSMVAISELVKNAYDADADNVTVSFCNIGTDKSFLIIKDDGDGMNTELLTSYWLRIGTDYKTDVTRSNNKGRVLTGAKGLGRLGIDRLCHKLILQTKQPGMDYVLELHVDWQKYEKPRVPLSEILHDIYKVKIGVVDAFGESFPGIESKGTRLIIQGLKDNWTEPFLSSLKQELSLLVSPFCGINDFKIILNTGITDLDGQLSATKMLDVADWVVNAELDSNEEVTITAISNRYKQTYTDGPHKWKEWLKDRGEHPECGPFKFNLYFMTRDTPNLKEINLKRKDLKGFLEINQGIRIYRDNFRVRPYGEPSGKGDWLNLGLRRAKNPEGITQKRWVIGPHQVVGAVFIGRETNHNLLDQTNREGIVEGPGFFDLRVAILKAITYFEGIAHEAAVKEDSPKPLVQAKAEAEVAVQDARKKATNLSQRLHTVASRFKEQSDEKQEIDSLIKDVEEVTSSVEMIVIATEEIEKRFIEENRELEADKDTLANLASLGILTVCFGHEAKEYTNLAAANAELLRQSYLGGHLELMPPYDKRFEKNIEILLECTDFIRSFAGFALGNIRPDKRKRSNVDLSETIGSVFKAMVKPLERQNIKVDLSKLAKVPKISAFKIDWESILINFITNSIAAMQDTPAEKRLIVADLKVDDEILILTFADSGTGLEAGTEEFIFQPMYTTRRDRKGNVEGTGMGLAIVKTFVEEHSGGTISVKSPGCLGGAEFEIKIPLSRQGREK